VGKPEAVTAKPYPWYYAVNDRPVKIVLLPDGGADCLVFDFATGGFVPDRSYFARVSDTGVGKDVDQLTEEEFETLVASQRRRASERRRETPIVWARTGNAELPYRARLGTRSLTIRVNDFPAMPLFTLLVDGQEVEDLDAWPSAWAKDAPVAP
jgi:hypothetical protein